MGARASAVARKLTTEDSELEGATADGPVLRSVLTTPVRPGNPAEWEALALEQAHAGPWLDSASVSAEIATRDPHRR